MNEYIVEVWGNGKFSYSNVVSAKTAKEAQAKEQSSIRGKNSYMDAAYGYVGFYSIKDIRLIK